MREDICKHWPGFVMFEENGECGDGVALASVTISEPVTIATIPCASRCDEATCDKRQFPTAEEIEARPGELEALMVRMMKAREAIVEKIGPYIEGKSDSGDIPCPVCEKGTLRYSRAGYNGHIHAACTNADCVRWME